MLRGRRREQEALDRLIAGVREGRSAALVLRGEPGIGKTALLDFAVQRADGARVLWVRGVEPEMELAFAGLHQLCAPLRDLLDMLPDPQREALRVALGMSSDDSPPDPFLVGLGVLGLLSEAAGERPALCVVDDADWLDRESLQTLAFVARRLGAESGANLFPRRAPVRGPRRRAADSRAHRAGRARAHRPRRRRRPRAAVVGHPGAAGRARARARAGRDARQPACAA